MGGLLSVLLVSNCGNSPETPKPIPKPNVLLITIDTTRADYLGCYGSPDVKTPVMDQLAGKGVQFMKNITAAGITNPSHVSIMTGLYAAHHNVYNNETRLAEEALTLAEVFKKEGYATFGAISARWLRSDNCNLGQGFDTFLGCDAYHLIAKDRNQELYEAFSTVNRPFFAWVHYFDPHGPYTPPPPYNIKYQPGSKFDPIPPSDRMDLSKELYKEEFIDPDRLIAQYKGEISYLDEEIGKLLKYLEENGKRKNTLIVNRCGSWGKHDRKRNLFLSCRDV